MLFPSRLCTCANHPRRPLRKVSSIGVRFSCRLISSFRMCSSLYTPRIPRSILIYAVTMFLFLFAFNAQHSLPCVRAGLMTTSYSFNFTLSRIVLSYKTAVSFRQLDHAACTPRSKSFRRLFHLYWLLIPGTWNDQNEAFSKIGCVGHIMICIIYFIV